MSNPNASMESYWSDVPNDTEQVRKFLHFNVLDADSLDFVKDNVSFSLRNSFLGNLDDFSKTIQRIEDLANGSLQDHSLADIVGWDAGQNITNNQDARMWLLEFAEFLREVLFEVANEKLQKSFDEKLHLPPRKYPVLVTRPRKFFYPE